MGFKGQNKIVGKIPDWVADGQSATLSYDEFKKLEKKVIEEYKEKEVQLNKEVKKLRRDSKKVEARVSTQYAQKQRDLERQISYLKKELNKNIEFKNKFFNEQELLFLLHFIKNSTFEGSQLDNVFSITLKLQDQYKLIQELSK